MIEANSKVDATLEIFRGGSHPLIFYREELRGRAPIIRWPEPGLVSPLFGDCWFAFCVCVRKMSR